MYRQIYKVDQSKEGKRTINDKLKHRYDNINTLT